MTPRVPRLRMFAGPNGSGKSTLKAMLDPEWLGTYVNADDIEREMKAHGNALNLAEYGVAGNQANIATFFERSTLLARAKRSEDARAVTVRDGVLRLEGVSINSYHASVIADFIRQDLVARGRSLSFETVMSHEDKVRWYCGAREAGFRCYLYYVATEDPAINVARVAKRVKRGGHAVPEDRIVERYVRSLGLLPDAIRCSDRAYLFDNTRDLALEVEYTRGVGTMVLADEAAAWIQRWVLERL